MSEHYVKVDDVEVVESSSSNALIVLVIAIIAIAVVAMVMWQPWTAPQPQSNSTTIIREGQQQPAPDNRPIIVNPPIRRLIFTMMCHQLRIRQLRLTPIPILVQQTITQQTTTHNN